jgi:RNA polymerase sigma factor (sigma-70 family)
MSAGEQENQFMRGAGAAAEPAAAAASQSDLERLARGEAVAWKRFVRRWTPVIHAAVLRRLQPAGRAGDAEDVAQEVFVRLLRGNRPLAGYDASRSSLSTFLTVLATSAAIDHLRRQRPTVPVESLPEHRLAVPPHEPRLRLKVPSDLLSPRQALVMTLIYEREMEVPEAARFLKVEAQTVRSLHHKALIRLRTFFGSEEGVGDASPSRRVSRQEG